MRKTLMLVAIPVAVVGVAVAVAVGLRSKSAKPNDSFAADLQQAQAAGLELAQAQGANKYALTEIAPEAKPQPSKAIKQGNGAKSVRSKSPTVKAAPENVAAEVVENVPDVQVTQTSAVPTPTEVIAPAVPRPVPQTTQSPSDQGPILAGGAGRGTGTTDNGGGWGGIFGAIIRGGVVDGDNCDPRSTPRTQRPPMRTPVYGGNPNGPASARMPVRPTLPNSVPNSSGGMIIMGRRRP